MQCRWHLSPDLLLQLALLTRHGRGLGSSVDFTRKEHAPRDDEEFPGKRDDRLAGAGLLRLAGIKLAEGAGVPPGEGVGCLYGECAEQRAARLADAGG